MGPDKTRHPSVGGPRLLTHGGSVRCAAYYAKARYQMANRRTGLQALQSDQEIPPGE